MTGKEPTLPQTIHAVFCTLCGREMAETGPARLATDMTSQTVLIAHAIQYRCPECDLSVCLMDGGWVGAILHQDENIGDVVYIKDEKEN